MTQATWIGRLLHRIVGTATPSRLPLAARFLGGTGAFSPTGVEIVRRPAKETVLVLAPHPDDEIIGPGGTIQGSLEAGGTVKVVYLTDGGGNVEDRETLIATRRREAETVGRNFGFEQVFWTLRDTRLDPSAAEDDLIRLLETDRPDTVYLPSFFEHHFDHYAANVLLARALAGTAVQPAIAGYEVWDNLPAANRVVDISAQLEHKLAAMRLYETPMRYTDFVDLIRHRAALHYLLHVDSARRSPEGAAEAFSWYDTSAFLQRFAEWDDELRRQGSHLVAHLDSL